MIELSPEAIAEYAWLAEEHRPTHAKSATQYALSLEGFELNTTYWLGRLDADGEFRRSEHTRAVSVRIPHENTRRPWITREDEQQMLAALFEAGGCPSWEDPRVAEPTPGKHRGDWKLRDLDAIAAWVEPSLRGRYVP